MLDPVTNDALGVIFKALLRLHPNGKKVQELPLRDQIGAMILVKVANHYSDNERLRFLSIIYTSMLGNATGLRPPREGESFVSLLDQVNN